jgi:hypothetical protein
MPNFIISPPSSLPTSHPTPTPTPPSPTFQLQISCLISIYQPSLALLPSSTSSHPDRIRLKLSETPIELNLIFDPPSNSHDLIYFTTEVRLEGETGGGVDPLSWSGLEGRLRSLIEAYFESPQQEQQSEVADEEESEQVQILYAVLEQVSSFLGEIKGDIEEDEYLSYEEILPEQFVNVETSQRCELYLYQISTRQMTLFELQSCPIECKSLDSWGPRLQP